MEAEEILAQRLKAYRDTMGYTQENMAYSLGLSTKGYRQIETCKVSTTLRTLSKISEVTEMSLVALLSRKESE